MLLVVPLRKLAILTTIWVIGAVTTTHAATLELINSTPVNDAVDISRSDALTMEFSVALAAYSVRADTVTLQSTAGAQKVSLNTSGAIVSVRPLTPMLPWTTYTLHAESLVGMGGEQLAAPIEIIFKTRDAAWQAPQQVVRMTATQWNPVTAVNIKGIRFVVWQQSNGSGDDIWATRYTPDGASANATRVASFPQDYISQLNVAVDGDGNAFVTWVVDKPPYTQPRRIWANRFTTGSGGGSGWGVPQAIDGYAARSATNLHLVFDRAGNAFALWQEYDCCATHSLQSIVANQYTKLTGWKTPVRLDDSYSFLAGKIDIQVDTVGNAFATWSTIEDIHYPRPQLKVSLYRPNIGWSPQQIVAVESTTNSYGHQALAVNPKGEALLMWADDTGLKYARAAQYGNWGAPILIDSTIPTSPSQMVFLDSGAAFAVFVSGVKQYFPAHGWWSWTHPLLNQQNASSDPRIVADLSGNALVAWTQTTGGIGRIYAKRYRAGSGWLGSTTIDAGNTRGGALQELFLDASGSAAAAWWQSNDIGTTDIQMAGFK